MLVLNVDSKADSKCQGRIKFDEAIEFAMRTSSSSDAPWIPLHLTYDSDSNKKIATIRGYDVAAHKSGNEIVTESVHICGDLLHDVQEVQFRWMGTNHIGGSGRVRQRMWALANVTASLVIENETIKILDDTFGQNALK